MKLSQIRLIRMILIDTLKVHWKNPKVKQVAIEIRDAIDQMFADDEELLAEASEKC